MAPSPRRPPRPPYQHRYRRNARSQRLRRTPARPPNASAPPRRQHRPRPRPLTPTRLRGRGPGRRGLAEAVRLRLGVRAEAPQLPAGTTLAPVQAMWPTGARAEVRTGREHCCRRRRSGRTTSRASRSGERTSDAGMSRCARLCRPSGRPLGRRTSASGRRFESSTGSRMGMERVAVAAGRGEEAAGKRGRRRKGGGRRRSRMGGRGRGARTWCCRRVRMRCLLPIVTFVLLWRHADIFLFFGSWVRSSPVLSRF